MVVFSVVIIFHLFYKSLIIEKILVPYEILLVVFLIQNILGSNEHYLLWGSELYMESSCIVTLHYPPYSVCKESLHHCLTFVLLHPPVLYLMYSLIRMQQFCHQKCNLPNINNVPLFHHPAHKVLAHSFCIKYKFSGGSFEIKIIYKSKLKKKEIT